jgi:ferritin
MLSERMQSAINAQINAEWYSEYLYYSMSAYFDSSGLPGMANWMNCQAQEEHFHTMKLFGYMNERGGRVILTAIEEPRTDWESPLAVFEAAYAHEQKVTGLINGLMDLALGEKDHGTAQMLQWFVEEQVEEEASADSVVQQLKWIGNSGQGMLMLDKELAARVFTPLAKGEK